MILTNEILIVTNILIKLAKYFFDDRYIKKEGTF